MARGTQIRLDEFAAVVGNRMMPYVEPPKTASPGKMVYQRPQYHVMDVDSCSKPIERLYRYSQRYKAYQKGGSLTGGTS